MDNGIFIELCKSIVVNYFNANVDKTDKKQITKDDVYIVWSCKTLQNNKALVSTNVPDGMYYEITHNGDKAEIYVDAYKKWENYKVERIIKSATKYVKNYTGRSEESIAENEDLIEAIFLASSSDNK